MTYLNESVAIVSGGSRGLGLAIVRRLLELDYRVATFSRSRTPEIDQLSRQDGVRERFDYESLDAQDTNALTQFVERVSEHFGRIDVLVNNAAIAHDGVLAMATDEEIGRMIDINLKASLVLAKECVRVMLVQQAGHIVNISSIIGQRGFSGLAAYAATKAGIDGMTRALARELGGRQIRVNAIAPGYLETEMSHGLSSDQHAQIVRRTPLGRLGRVDDIVPWLEFLLSDGSGFATGQVITVDGGATL